MGGKQLFSKKDVDWMVRDAGGHGPRHGNGSRSYKISRVPSKIRKSSRLSICVVEM